jgi:hypothetical protein
MFLIYPAVEAEGECSAVQCRVVQCSAVQCSAVQLDRACPVDGVQWMVWMARAEHMVRRRCKLMGELLDHVKIKFPVPTA